MGKSLYLHHEESDFRDWVCYNWRTSVTGVLYSYLCWSEYSILLDPDQYTAAYTS